MQRILSLTAITTTIILSQKAKCDTEVITTTIEMSKRDKISIELWNFIEVLETPPKIQSDYIRYKGMNTQKEYLGRIENFENLEKVKSVKLKEEGEVLIVVYRNKTVRVVDYVDDFRVVIMECELDREEGESQLASFEIFVTQSKKFFLVYDFASSIIYGVSIGKGGIVARKRLTDGTRRAAFDYTSSSIFFTFETQKAITILTFFETSQSFQNMQTLPLFNYALGKIKNTIFVKGKVYISDEASVQVCTPNLFKVVCEEKFEFDDETFFEIFYDRDFQFDFQSSRDEVFYATSDSFGYFNGSQKIEILGKKINFNHQMTLEFASMVTIEDSFSLILHDGVTDEYFSLMLNFVKKRIFMEKLNFKGKLKFFKNLGRIDKVERFFILQDTSELTTYIQRSPKIEVDYSKSPSKENFVENLMIKLSDSKVNLNLSIACYANIYNMNAIKIPKTSDFYANNEAKIPVIELKGNLLYLNNSLQGNKRKLLRLREGEGVEMESDIEERKKLILMDKESKVQEIEADLQPMKSCIDPIIACYYQRSTKRLFIYNIDHDNNDNKLVIMKAIFEIELELEDFENIQTIEIYKKYVVFMIKDRTRQVLEFGLIRDGDISSNAVRKTYSIKNVSSYSILKNDQKLVIYFLFDKRGSNGACNTLAYLDFDEVLREMQFPASFSLISQDQFRGGICFDGLIVNYNGRGAIWRKLGDGKYQVNIFEVVRSDAFSLKKSVVVEGDQDSIPDFFLLRNTLVFKSPSNVLSLISYQKSSTNILKIDLPGSAEILSHSSKLDTLICKAYMGNSKEVIFIINLSKKFDTFFSMINPVVTESSQANADDNYVFSIGKGRAFKLTRIEEGETDMGLQSHKLTPFEIRVTPIAEDEFERELELQFIQLSKNLEKVYLDQIDSKINFILPSDEPHGFPASKDLVEVADKETYFLEDMINFSGYIEDIELSPEITNPKIARLTGNKDTFFITDLGVKDNILDFRSHDGRGVFFTEDKVKVFVTDSHQKSVITQVINDFQVNDLVGYVSDLDDRVEVYYGILGKNLESDIEEFLLVRVGTETSILRQKLTEVEYQGVDFIDNGDDGLIVTFGNPFMFRIYSFSGEPGADLVLQKIIWVKEKGLTKGQAVIIDQHLYVTLMYLEFENEQLFKFYKIDIDKAFEIVLRGRRTFVEDLIEIDNLRCSSVKVNREEDPESFLDCYYGRINSYITKMRFSIHEEPGDSLIGEIPETQIIIKRSKFLEGLSGYKPKHIEAGKDPSIFLITYKSVKNSSVYIHGLYCLNSTTRYPSITYSSNSFQSSITPRRAHLTTKDKITVSFLTKSKDSKSKKLKNFTPSKTKLEVINSTLFKPIQYSLKLQNNLDMENPREYLFNLGSILKKAAKPVNPGGNNQTIKMVWLVFTLFLVTVLVLVGYMMMKIRQLKREKQLTKRNTKLLSSSSIRKSFHEIVKESIEDREEKRREDEIKTRSFLSNLHTDKYKQKVRKEQMMRQSFNQKLRKSSQRGGRRSNSHRYRARY